MAIVLGTLAFGSFVTLERVFVFLREHHESVFKRLGSPSVTRFEFGFSNSRAVRRGLLFILKREYRGLGSARLDRLCAVARIFEYLFSFAILVGILLPFILALLCDGGISWACPVS